MLLTRSTLHQGVTPMKPFFQYPRVAMPVEIEAKMKVDEVAGLIGAVVARGGTPIGQYLEEDSFFDTEDRALLAADEGLRLRVSTNIDTRAERVTITHKGSNRHGSLKCREETEVSVGSAADAARLLEHLGYVRLLTFQKKRLSYKLDGCRIEIDEVPHLGHFVEIEGSGEGHVMRVREMLGLSERPLIKASYAAMLLAWMQERGETAGRIVFVDGTAPPIAKAG
jgi:adenylate cyclase, class 2